MEQKLITDNIKTGSKQNRSNQNLDKSANSGHIIVCWRLNQQHQKHNILVETEVTSAIGFNYQQQQKVMRANGKR